MSNIKQVGSLEVPQDERFQHIEWRIQRLGWALMALVLLAAALGLLGDGPLANAHSGDEGSGLRADYERITRRHAASELTLHVTPPTAGEPLRLLIPSDYLAAMKVEQIDPPPSTVRLAGDEQVLEFDTDAGPDARAPSRITFHLMPERTGRVHGQIRVDGGPQLQVSHFTFP